MKRIAEDYLRNWLYSRDRKPLILRGARQVGKSTLVKLFAKSNKLKLIEINFETVSFMTLQDEEIDIEEFKNEIESKFKATLNEESLVFLDEIQKSPQAFMALRYFYEKYPSIPVIAAGSLLEFLFANETISVPVGRIEYYHLGPMNFLEFLMATDEEQILKQLKKNGGKLSKSNFEALQKRLHEYLFVGGMPEAVRTFIETKSIQQTRKVHRSIIQTYQDDFPKYAKKSQYERLCFVFSRLHNFVGKKVKYSEISLDYQSKEIKSCIELLEKARVITRCFHTNASDISLTGSEDISTYKIYFLDVGLWGSILKSKWEDIAYLHKAESPLKGTFYEQFIAQHLAYFEKGLDAPKLFYWLRDKKSEQAEVDFLIEVNGEKIPVEVKSGAAGKMKSLNQFMGEKKLVKAVRFDASENSLTKPVQEIGTYYFKQSSMLPVKFRLLNLHLSQIISLEEALKR